MKLLTNEQRNSYQNSKICYICEEKIVNRYVQEKKYRKVRDHCHYTGEYRGTTCSICNSKYSVPRKILIDFHNGSMIIILL